MLDKTLESPLDSKEIKPVNPKGNQPWIFIRKTDAEALILWPPDVKSWLIAKDLDAGKDWGQEKKRATEDEMVGWHHRFNGHKPEQTPEDSEGQGSLACCSPWGCKYKRKVGDFFFKEGLGNKRLFTYRKKKCSYSRWELLFAAEVANSWYVKVIPLSVEDLAIKYSP